MSDEDLAQAQSEVQRLVGRCVLRLQEYEQLLKAVLAHHDVAGSIDDWPEAQARQVRKVADQTMGNLVSRFVESFMTVAGSTAQNSSVEDSVGHFRFRIGIELTASNHRRMKDELREFTMLRNELVHNFVKRHKLQLLDGCRDALEALTAASDKIDRRVEDLRSWVSRTDEARLHAARFIQSGAFREWFVDGIAPDGAVIWPLSGVVRALKEASASLAVDGWTLVVAASRWILDREPEQTPAKYGCRSWRQVLHESRMFELRYRQGSGRREAWYRER